MKKTAAFLLTGFVGVLALLAGLAVDAYLHARDPGLAHREGLFSLANPGHVLLGVGIALVVFGVVGAAYTSLPYGIWVRRGLLAGALALIVVSGDIAGWAASVERSQPNSHTLVARSHSVAGSDQPVTEAQLAAATRLMIETRAEAAKYKDQSVAIAAGYRPMEPPDLEIVHFVNSAYLSDSDVLRTDHVQSLIYFNSPQGPMLIGAMYIMPRPGMPGPQVGGSLTVWHQHSNLCFDKETNMIVAFRRSAFFDRSDKSGSCPKGSSKGTTPEMLHVWIINNPGGPFGSDMDPDVLGTKEPIS